MRKSTVATFSGAPAGKKGRGDDLGWSSGDRQRQAGMPTKNNSGRDQKAAAGTPNITR